MPAQPPDEWTYLRPEEFADDDALEKVDAKFETGAENAALHLVDVDETQIGTQGLDPGETLERPQHDGIRTAQYFDDEEPEVGAAPSVPDEDASAEPRVDQILDSQHYTFEQDSQ
jgi:hypothetical protein